MEKSKNKIIMNEEFRTIVSLITSVVVSCIYFSYLFFFSNGTGLGAENEIVFWARAILLLIPVRIVGEIVITILMTIVSAIINQTDEHVELKMDERDEVIDLKSRRNSQYGFAIAFLIGIIVLALGYEAIIMFQILIVAMLFVEITEHVSKLLYYRKGF